MKGVKFMRERVNVLPDHRYKNRLTLNRDVLQRMGCAQMTITFIRFGHDCCEVELDGSTEIEEDEMLLSHQIISQLNLPLEPVYELKFNQYELILGPFIGILVSRKKEFLDESVSVLSNYLYDYEQIGGAIIAFAAESIDMQERKIDGYLYNPKHQKWEPGQYDYPSAIFKRAGFSKTLREHFHAILGDKIFNSYMFNKWEMHDWLSSFSEIRPFLPETILYKSDKDVIWFLDQFGQAFIKPIYGSQGMGIIHAEQVEQRRYVFRFKEAGQSQTLYFTSVREVRQFIRERLKPSSFIIQQALSLLKETDKVIDFRMLLVKNAEGEWEDFGLITRIGKSGHFVSNISDGGLAEKGEETFRRVLGYSEAEAFQLRHHISKLAIDAAQCLEQCGIHLGNLGFDLSLDQDKRLWIIEINNKDPNHTIAIDAHDRQMFYRVKRANMMYAKKLAGFGGL